MVRMLVKQKKKKNHNIDIKFKKNISKILGLSRSIHTKLKFKSK